MLQQLLGILGLFLSFLLIYYNFKKKKGAIYIGLFFFFFSAYNYFQYVILYSESVELISFAFIHTAFIGFLLGPMLLFYVRNTVAGSCLFRKIDLLHFIPVVLFFVASFKYYLIPWHIKMDIAGQIVNDKQKIVPFSNEYLGWLISNYMNYFGRPLLLFLYSGWSVISLIRFVSFKNRINKERLSQPNLNWLFILLVFILLLSFVQALLVLISAKGGNINLFYNLNIFQVLSGVALIGIIVVPFFYPSVLYGLSENNLPEILMTTTEQLESATASENEMVEKQMMQRIAEFDPEYIQFIEKEVENYMESDKPYLLRDCNITYFAKVMNLPQHHLSFYFKEVRKQPFNEFRNSWRVKHAKALIEENMDKIYTLETIGKMSGFSSKNAFFVAFKKTEGITPGSYTSGKLA